MSLTLENLSVRTATHLTRRRFLGRSLGTITAAVAGTAMSVVLPEVRASAASCPPVSCPCGKRAVFGSCWAECGRCCGDRLYYICDCCTGGAGCNPNHLCSHSGCNFCAESFYNCTQAVC